MNFFRKKSTAVIIAALVVLSSTLISVNVKLGAKAKQVIDGFYTGVWDSASDAASASSHLKNICAAADGLVTIADNYGLDTEDVDWDSDSLKLSISYSDDDMDYIYYCYDDLCASVDKLTDQMHRAELNQRDALGLQQYENTIQGAKSALAQSHYNDVVREFYTEYGGFATSEFLTDLADVALPRYFDYGW